MLTSLKEYPVRAIVCQLSLQTAQNIVEQLFSIDPRWSGRADLSKAPLPLSNLTPD